VGQRDVCGRPALPGRHLADHPAQELPGQLLRGALGVAEQERDVVAEVALELAGHPVRPRGAAARRGLTDLQDVVVAQEQHGRDGVRALAERNGLGAPVAPGGRCGVGGAEVDSQAVRPA
jgi:hypothetical protein